MIFTKITLKNLRNFSGETSHSFDISSKGITLIVGPMQAGKSTILESILLAIYQKPKTNQEEINNSYQVIDYEDSRLPFEIDLEFEHGDKKCRIYKIFAGNTAKSQSQYYEKENDTWGQPETGDAAEKAVRRYVDESIDIEPDPTKWETTKAMINMNNRAINKRNVAQMGIGHVLYYLQKDLSNIPSELNESTKQRIQKESGVEFLDNITREVLKKIKDNKENNIASKTNMARMLKGGELTSLEEDYAAFLEKKNLYEINISHINEYSNNIDFAEKNIQKFETKKRKLEAATQESENISKAREEFEKLEKDFKNTKQEKDDYLELQENYLCLIDEKKKLEDEKDESKEEATLLKGKKLQFQETNNKQNELTAAINNAPLLDLAHTYRTAKTDKEDLEKWSTELKKLRSEKKKLENEKIKILNRISTPNNKIIDFPTQDDQSKYLALLKYSAQITFNLGENFKVKQKSKPTELTQSEFKIYNKEIFEIENVGDLEIIPGSTDEEYINLDNFVFKDLMESFPELQQQGNQINGDLESIKEKIEGLLSEQNEKDVEDDMGKYRNTISDIEKHEDIENIKKHAQKSRGEILEEKKLLGGLYKDQEEFRKEMNEFEEKINKVSDLKSFQPKEKEIVRKITETETKMNVILKKYNENEKQLATQYELDLNAKNKQESILNGLIEDDPEENNQNNGIKDIQGKIDEEKTILTQNSTLKNNLIENYLGNLNEDEIDEEIEILGEKINKKYEEILSYQVLSKLGERFKKEQAIVMSKPLKDLMDPWIKRVFPNEYSGFNLNEDDIISGLIEEKTGHERSVNYNLSAGTLSIIFILNKLALAKWLSKNEKYTIILDDPLKDVSDYNEKKYFTRVKTIIKEVSEDIPIIITSNNHLDYTSDLSPLEIHDLSVQSTIP